jgi:predicted porin
MKKSLLALAVLGAFAGAASAQSSLTVFGIVDASIRWVDNDAGDLWSLSTNGLSTSRLGFRGLEDLGGGLKAGFWLEHGVLPDTGGQTEAARFWNRRATVSLISDALGEIRLGRDYTPTFWNLTEFDPFGTNGVGDSTIMFPGRIGVQAIDTITRADNVVGYFLPANLGGIYGQAAYAFPEGNENNHYAGGRIGWQAGPFNAALAYGQTWTNTSGHVKTADLGVSWDFGFFKLMGQVASLQWSPDQGDVTRTNYLIGTTIPVGAGIIRAAYTYSDFTNDGPACPAAVTVSGTTTLLNCDNAQMFSLGYIYNLSKRTAVYTTVALIDNDDNSAITHTPSKTLVPPQGFGEKSTAFEMGIRHAF